MNDQEPQPSPPGEEHADFERLYSMHHHTVLAYCARRCSRSDAWDAASEVFLVALRRPDQVPPPEEALAWLLGVAYRVLANQWRSQRRRRSLAAKAAGMAGEADPHPDEVLIRSEEATEVLEALARLRPADREVIQLTLWEELSPTEIAEVLGISRPAVDQRYSRAKKRLARELSGQGFITRRATQVRTEKGGAA
jgi:RNA polymerase sigma-70 factor, ECF subfamily